LEIHWRKSPPSRPCMWEWAGRNLINDDDDETK
jgi:hypothetical protein